MNDLLAFIRARLAEDERDAQEVERLIESGLEVPGAVTYSPARVLREVEAKRRILDAYEAQIQEHRRLAVLVEAETAKGGEMTEEVAHLTGLGIQANTWRKHLDWVVRVMTTAYADHPDYSPEWSV